MNVIVIGRFWFNEEAQQVKSLLNLKNNYLKIFYSYKYPQTMSYLAVNSCVVIDLTVFV